MSEAPAGSGSFAGPVPRTATAIEFVRDGTVLDRLERSRPPTVRLEPLRQGRAIGVRWISSDPDHDALQAIVEYSPDGGRTWSTVFMAPDRGHARISAHSLSTSRDARLRVRVSDGFSESHAVSPHFTAAGRPATVRIARPAAGEPLRSGAPTLRSARRSTTPSTPSPDAP